MLGCALTRQPREPPFPLVKTRERERERERDKRDRDRELTYLSI